MYVYIYIYIYGNPAPPHVYIYIYDSMYRERFLNKVLEFSLSLRHGSGIEASFIRDKLAIDQRDVRALSRNVRELSFTCAGLL